MKDIFHIKLKRNARISFLLIVCLVTLLHNLDSRMQLFGKLGFLVQNENDARVHHEITNFEAPPTGNFIDNETGLFETLLENVAHTVKFSRNNTLTMKRISALGAGLTVDVDCNTFSASSPSNPSHIAGSHSMFDLEFDAANGIDGTVTYEFEFSDVLSSSGYMMFVDFDSKETFKIKAYDASGNLIPYSQFSFVRENGNYATGSTYTNTVFNDIGASYSGELTTQNGDSVSDPVVTLQGNTPVKRVVFEVNFNIDNDINESKSASFGFINPTSPTTVYVNSAATGSNDGTTWGNAFTTLQQGYENSFEGDQLWVAKGVYKPTSTNLLPNSTTRNNHFRIPEGVEVYGGFAGTESNPGQRVNFNFGETNNTVLSGDLLGDDNYTVTPWTGTGENTYHVIYQPNEESCKLSQSTILDGFSIIGGYANGPTTNNSNDGGGFFLDDHSPILRNIDLINNACIDRGGGMYMIDCQSVLENIIVRNNRAETTGGDGGGMYILDSGPAFTNCLIVDNYTGTDGGGLYIETSIVTMNNATIANNRADDDGGGIYLTSDVNTDNIQLRNSIVWGNSAGDVANQIRRGTALAVLINSLYSNGTNDLSGSTPSTGSSNNLTSDPQFIDAAAKDYRIKRASPAADAGNNSYNSLTTDIRRGSFGRKLLKTNFMQAGTIDMGAYELYSSIDDCSNPTSGGNIAAAQIGINPFDPAAFTNTTAPSGHSGTLEYKWQSSTTSSLAGFSDISSTNSDTYDAGSVTQTTWFKRLARVDCKTDWTNASESNVLEVTTVSGTTVTTTATACDSYTWSANGQTYSVSGTYTSVSGTTINVLVLTVLSSTSTVNIIYWGGALMNTNSKSGVITLAARVVLPVGADATQSQLRFLNRDTNQPISGWLPVNLVVAHESHTGFASYQYSVTLGPPETERNITIGFELGGPNSCFTRNDVSDNVSIMVNEVNSCGCD